MLFNVLLIVSVIMMIFFCIYLKFNRNTKALYLYCLVVLFNLWFYRYSGFFPMNFSHRWYLIIYLTLFIPILIIILIITIVISKSEIFEKMKLKYSLVMMIIFASYFYVLFAIFMEYGNQIYDF